MEEKAKEGHPRKGKLSVTSVAEDKFIQVIQLRNHKFNGI